MWPFTPVWNSNNLSKALKAVKKITNQKTLARIVRTASSEWVRLDAIGKLDSLDVLAGIEAQILSASMPLGVFDRIREVVVALEDQSALVALAKGHATPVYVKKPSGILQIRRYCLILPQAMTFTMCVLWQRIGYATHMR